MRLSSIFDRLVPALVMATSVTLLTAGLLSYAPATFGDPATPDPDLIAGDPLGSVAPDVLPTGDEPVDATRRPDATDDPLLPTLEPGSTATPRPSGPPASPTPISSPDPTVAPSDDPDRPRQPRASRIRIASLGIDLPVVPSDLVVRGNPDFYPLCDVAMFMRAYVDPGEIGATYIYAHAQRGMFGPLLAASRENDGRGMIGALVEVYTTDNMLHLYELHKVKRHATDLSITETEPGEHILVLQTSEGPTGHIPKLQVAARPLSVVPSTRAEARPDANPRVCAPH